MTGSKKSTVQITIDLTASAYERLNKIETVFGASSKADLVGDALLLYEFLAQKAHDGYEFSMRRPDGPSERLVLFDMDPQ